MDGVRYSPGSAKAFETSLDMAARKAWARSRQPLPATVTVYEVRPVVVAVERSRNRLVVTRLTEVEAL